MTAASSHLAALLDAPPPGVAVRQELDRIEVRLRKVPQRRWWASLGAGLAFCALSLVGATLNPPSDALWIGLLLLGFVGLVLAFGSLGELIRDRLGRACRLTLTPHGVKIKEAAASCTLELETIAALGVRPWPETGSTREGRPGRLGVQAQKRRYDLLRGVSIGHLQWLVEILEAAIQQRKASLLAAGHHASFLAQPPPEAAALQAMTRRAGEPS